MGLFQEVRPSVCLWRWETPPLESRNKRVAANSFGLLRIRRLKAQRDLIESHTAVCVFKGGVLEAGHRGHLCTSFGLLISHDERQHCTQLCAVLWRSRRSAHTKARGIRTRKTQLQKPVVWTGGPTHHLQLRNVYQQAAYRSVRCLKTRCDMGRERLGLKWYCATIVLRFNTLWHMKAGATLGRKARPSGTAEKKPASGLTQQALGSCLRHRTDPETCWPLLIPRPALISWASLPEPGPCFLPSPSFRPA